VLEILLIHSMQNGGIRLHSVAAKQQPSPRSEPARGPGARMRNFRQNLAHLNGNPHAVIKATSMKHELVFKGFEPTPAIRNLIESRISHLDRLSQSLPANPLFLRCSIEELPVRKLFHVTVNLDVPLKTITAKTETHDAKAALHSAFEEIETQLQAYKSGLRGEQWWTQIARRRQLQSLKAAPVSADAADDPQWFFVLVEPHLAKLCELTGRVLRYAESRGALSPGELDLDSVVDAALARAYNEFPRHPASHNTIQRRLLRFAVEEIKAAVNRARTNRAQSVSIQKPGEAA
jgi:ribosome-associated translation inhibitor RaiA